MEHIASEFLVSTCRIHAKFNINTDLLTIPLIKERSPHWNNGQVGLMSGSEAEFYIQPINPCIDDIDIICPRHCCLAFDSSRCAISEDEGELFDLILFTKLEAYEQNKSFVRLRGSDWGIYDWNLDEYTILNMPLMRCEQRDIGQGRIKLNDLPEHTPIHTSTKGIEINLEEALYGANTPNGPAIKCKNQLFTKSIDFVTSVRCPNWPLVAHEWPMRKRYSGWPNKTTITKVVQDGCDVVAVAHRDMHEDLNQWRFSFSRAEVTLIQSWTPTQQIVYHLLRFFIKREIIRKNCPKSEEIVCTYHLKTLMLWSCEEESTEWWKTSSVVAICCKLCDNLCECLKHKHCPNYFIRESNLLDHELNSEILQQTIKTLEAFSDVEKMSQWFMTYYILPVYQELCDQNETLLTEEKVQSCMVSVCEYYEKRKICDLNWDILSSVFRCYVTVQISYSTHWLNSDEKIWMIEMTAVSKIHATFADYTKALILIQMSKFMLSPKLQRDAEDVVSEIWIQIVRQSCVAGSPDSLRQRSVLEGSMIYLNRAEQIMKHLVFDYSNNENCLAQIASMLCLHKSLCCHDISSAKTETVSRIYLAALFYYTGHRQCTLHLCSQVATSYEENDHCHETRNLKLNCLLFIDDLASIAGFLLLRRYMLRIRSKGFFFLSHELFVHYMLFQCIQEIPKTKEILKMSLPFEADCCLAAVMRYRISRCSNYRNHLIVYTRCVEDSQVQNLLPGITDIAETFARISTDYMNRFYDSLSKEFGSNFNLASCYEALSLYLFRRYKDVLCLCEKILEDSEHDSDLEQFPYLNVYVNVYLIAYFDEDIQALVGFLLLALRFSSLYLGYFWRILGYTIKMVPRTTLAFSHPQSYAADLIFCKAFNPILTRQFLANYLKLRCLLDLGFPLLEVKSAFRCLKSRYLFEQTVLHFIRQKIIRHYHVTTIK